MTSPNTVTAPERGVSYSLAVHGEPPEGVEVLWGGNSSGRWDMFQSFWHTHWMLAPVPAPEPAETDEGGGEPKKGHKGMTAEEFYARRDKPMVDHLKASRDLPDDATVLPWNETPEAPPFPLSREELDHLLNGEDSFAFLNRVTDGWWYRWQLSKTCDVWRDPSAVVSAWHAAGCPGAVDGASHVDGREADAERGGSNPPAPGPEAPGGEAEEGPWALSIRNGDHYITRNGLLYIISPTLPERLETIISDANDAHRLRGELASAKGRFRQYVADIQAVLTKGEVYTDPPRLWTAREVRSAVRSLVARAEKAEEEAAEDVAYYLGFALGYPSMKEARAKGARDLVIEAAHVVAKAHASHAGEGE